MNRPILIATIGMIIGIIWGLYLNTSTILFFLIVLTCFFILFRKRVRFINKIYRYLKLVLKINVIITLFVSIFLSALYTEFKKMQYEKINDVESIILTGEIKSSQKENKYSYSYKILIEDKLYILYTKTKNGAKEFEYGDIVKLLGKIEAPEDARNYCGFSQKEYYMSKGIYANVYASKIEKINHSFSLAEIGNNAKEKIKAKIQRYISNENASVLLAILIGEKDDIPDMQLEEFRESSLIHILCVSRCTYKFYSFMGE